MTATEISNLLADPERIKLLQLLWARFNFERYTIDELHPITPAKFLEETSIDDREDLDTHLTELEGRVLQRRDGGYVLTPAGYTIMRSFESAAAGDHQTIDETELPSPCPFCEAPLFVRFNRDILRVWCQSCSGIGGDGNINYVHIQSRSPAKLNLEALLDVATMELSHRVQFSRTGICPECYSEIGREVRICDTHSLGPTGTCEDCDDRFAADIYVDCPACNWSGIGPLLEYALLEPTAIHQYELDHGMTVFHRGPWDYRIEALGRVSESIHEGDPTRIIYEFDFDDPVIVEFAIADDNTLKNA